MQCMDERVVIAIGTALGTRLDPIDILQKPRKFHRLLFNGIVVSPTAPPSTGTITPLHQAPALLARN